MKIEELKQFTSFEEILSFDEKEAFKDIVSVWEFSNGLIGLDLENIIEVVGFGNLYFDLYKGELEVYIDSNNISLKSWLKLFEYNCDCGCELVEMPSKIVDYSEIKDGLFLLEW